jgi:hypothetical protein
VRFLANCAAWREKVPTGAESDDNRAGRLSGKEAFEKLQAYLNDRFAGGYLKKLALRIDQGVDAKETKFFQHEGKVTETRDVVAWGPRAAFAKVAVDVFGATAPQKREITGKGGGPVLVIHEPVDEGGDE